MEQNDSTQDKSSEQTRDEAVTRMQQRIAEDEKARQEGRPRPRFRERRLPPFWIGFLATVVPIVGISVISAILQASARYPQDFFWLWWLAVGLEVAAGIAAIVLSVRRAGSIASGMWVGFAVCILALGTTCFANVISSI